MRSTSLPILLLLLLLLALTAACVPEVRLGQFQCDPLGTDQCPEGWWCAPKGTSYSCIDAETNVCGNGILEAGEQCDSTELDSTVCDELGVPGGTPYCIFPMCAIYCPRCGNGIIDLGEDCDDRNATTGDGCSSTCRLEYCGNGIIDPGEACDDGPDNSNSNPDGCTLDCRRSGLTVLHEGDFNAIAIDSTHVYWGDSLGAVGKVPLAGGTPTTLNNGGGQVLSLAVDSTHVYWMDDVGTMKKVSLNNGARTTLYSAPMGGGGDLVIDSTHAYIFDGADFAVKKIPLSGGTPITLAEADVAPEASLALDSTHVYWGDLMYLYRVPKTGGTPDTLVSEQGETWAIAVDSTHIYWWTSVGSSGAEQAVMKMPLPGGTPTLLASNQGFVSSLAVDSTHVYWTTWGDEEHTDAVMKMPLAGGTPVTLASDQVAARSIRVDSTHVYWVNGMSIMRSIK